ncbi:MAG: NADH-quinone oxidoreductase subunit N [Candidatus Omnitrophica bacterium]|nr:NADH-quinone oxidoreductase subunit N [Candidatus Omnitrophota bacterium]
MVDLQYLYPELVLFGFALISLIWGVLSSNKSLIASLAFTGLICALLLLPSTFDASTSAFSGLLVGDGFSAFFRALILLATALIIMLSMADLDILDEDKGEYYFFLLSLAVSLMLAVSSRNLLMIYVSVEAVSVLSYILVAYFKRDVFSSEAGIKYFLFGALSTGVMLYGISLLYGIFGNLDLLSISAAVAKASVVSPVFLIAIVFVLGGMAFKCSLVPFHMAAPDAYQGAPTPVSAFLSVGPKAMGFALLIRFLFTGDSPLIVQWSCLAQALAMITMTVGNMIALKQTNVKRMLAYSSIAHAGFMLIALAVGTSLGIKAILFYLFVYVFMNIGAFGSVIYTNREEISQYAGLSRKNPYAALMMTISLLSLAGLPPLSGFMAKFVVIAAAVQSKFYALAIVAVLNSVLALFYYLKIIKMMYLSKEDDASPLNISSVLTLVLTLTLVANLFLGIWPHGAIQWITLP